MSVSFGSNISSLKAQRQLGNVSTEVSTVFERLSSGQRINKASDDAAGLAVVSSLQNNRRVFTQGIRNYNDGISLLNVADGAIEQLSSITIRLKELSEQAASGTYGAKQRKSIDAEAQALSKEYFRIARSTTFNGRGVFFAEFGELRLQGGYGSDGGVQSGLGGAIGSGTFGSATSFTLNSGAPTSLVLGDLNGDGIQDLVSGGYYGSGTLTVRLGIGNGVFGGTTTYAGENDGVSLGDLNGDGVLDLVTIGYDDQVGQVKVRLGNGNGTFGSSISYATGSGNPRGVALGDLNGDGMLDLVAGCLGELFVAIGKGDGAFGTFVTQGPGTTAEDKLALTDFNSDGILDLVSAGQTNDVDVRLGTGTGSFGTVTSYSVSAGGATTGVSVGDLNGDGKQDLVATADDGRAVVRLGLGNGTFGATTSYQMESTSSSSVSLGDLNGDGFLDLVTAGSQGAGGGRVTIRLGAGDGTFGAALSYITESSSSAALALGDLNGDGVLDIVTAGVGGGGRTTTRLSNTLNGISPLLSFKLTTRADALQALTQFDQALNRLSTQRGIIGAFQSRITVAGNVLQASAENYAAAAGRIKDADVADESSKLVRTQILQQAASAVLAQANQQPALALQLIK